MSLYQQTKTLALVCLLVLGQGAALAAGKGPEGNPGRPTVSTPATLTPVGYLQFENGALYAAGSPGLTAQFSLNQVTKLAICSRLQLLSSWEPFARSSGSGGAPNQPGGVSLGAQAVVLPGSGPRPAVSVGYWRSVYGGKSPDIDVGSAYQSGLILLSGDYGPIHIDMNGIVSQQTGNGYRRAQYGQTLSVSHGFGSVTVASELWHFTQPLLNGNAVGNLWAVSYAASPQLVFDAGFNHGLTSTSTHWEAFTGFTYLLPHALWHTH